jgi:hypothetical protein
LTGGTQITATLEGQVHSTQDQGGMQERPTDLQPWTANIEKQSVYAV